VRPTIATQPARKVADVIRSLQRLKLKKQGEVERLDRQRQVGRFEWLECLETANSSGHP
jgi:hypothetical protein